MSYLRGEYYTYTDGSTMQLPSSVIPMDIFDVLVIMRYAQLTKKQIKKSEKLAMNIGYGNFGCDALLKKHGKPTSIDWIKEWKKEEDKKKNEQTRSD